MRLLGEPHPDQRAKAWATTAHRAWALDDSVPLPKHSLELIARLTAIPALPGGLVPIRIIDVNTEQDADKALAIEVAENEKRRDYTKQEVVALSQRLKDAGYRMARGKPKAGEHALGPALAVIIGKSERQVRRILGGNDSRTDVLISPKTIPVVLQRLQKAILALQEAATGPQKRRLAGVLMAAETLTAAIATLEDVSKE